IVTWVLCPAASVPDAGDTISLPTKLDGSEMDHDTGPFSAVRVSAPPPDTVSTMVVGDTSRVPGAGGGVADRDGDDGGDCCAEAGGADEDCEPGTDAAAAAASAPAWGTPGDEAATGTSLTPGAGPGPPVPPRPP